MAITLMRNSTRCDSLATKVCHDHKSELMTYWETRAKYFEMYSTWCSNLELFRLCTEPLQDLPKDVNCLDFGGGSGWIARRDEKLSGRQWTVLDLCPYFSQYVKPPVTFMVGDVHSTPFPNASFAYVLIRSVLHYVNDRRTLTEANRLLPAGGCLVVAQKVVTYDQKDQGWFAELNRLKCPQTHREWRALQLSHTLELVGFEVFKCTSHTERRKINVRKWFGDNSPLANPNQDKINNMFRHAPASVTKNLQLVFEGDELVFDEHWAVFICRKRRHSHSENS